MRCGGRRELAGALMMQGNYGEAGELYMQTLETQKRVLGESHPDVKLSLSNFDTMQEVMQSESAGITESVRAAVDGATGAVTRSQTQPKKSRRMK